MDVTLFGRQGEVQPFGQEMLLAVGWSHAEDALFKKLSLVARDGSNNLRLAPPASAAKHIVIFGTQIINAKWRTSQCK